MEKNIVEKLNSLKNTPESLILINPVEQIDLFLYENLINTLFYDLFEIYWLKCRENYTQEFIFNFLIDFLTIQNKGKITNGVNVVKLFITYFKKYKNKDILSELFVQITKYIKYYDIIVNEKSRNDKINNLLHRINKMQNKEAYPYLMEVFEDYEYARINTDMLIEILNTVILFINHQCDEQEDSIITNFNQLSKEINKMLLLKVLTPKIVKVEVES